MKFLKCMHCRFECLMLGHSWWPCPDYCDGKVCIHCKKHVQGLS